MRARGVYRYGLAAIAAFVAVALPVPAPAVALDSDLKGFAVFRVDASDGYEIFVLASSERADNRGDAALIVHRPGETVVYAAPATVSPAKFEADLGTLGQISLDIVPSGTRKTLRSRCGGDSLSIEPDVYRGTFEFRGEEGFTEATATRIPEFSRFILDFGCAVSGEGESRGPGLPGARLRVQAGKGHLRTSLQINQNRPGAPTLFEAGVAEKRGRIEIERSVSGRTPSNAFDFDPLLRTANLDLPPPFSGSASFHRNASPANRWTGSLSVDFPGRSGVELAPRGARVTLVHARLSRS